MRDLLPAWGPLEVTGVLGGGNRNRVMKHDWVAVMSSSADREGRPKALPGKPTCSIT
jgi:hypothetical protein